MYDKKELPMDTIVAQNKARLVELEQHPVLAPFASHIFHLELKKQRTLKEERELQLLLDPTTTNHAFLMACFEFTPNLTESDNRHFQLLKNPIMRSYAFEITIQLEPYIIDQSGAVDNEKVKKLASYYFIQLRDLPKEQHFVFDFISPASQCRSTLLHNKQNNTTNDGIIVTRLHTEFKLFEEQIHKAAKIITTEYLKMKQVTSSIEQTASMQSFIRDKTILLELSLKRHIAQHMREHFNQASLNTLIELIKNKIANRQFSLEGNKLFNIASSPNCENASNTPSEHLGPNIQHIEKTGQRRNIFERRKPKPNVNTVRFFDPGVNSHASKLISAIAQKLEPYGVTTALISLHWKTGVWTEVHSNTLKFLVDELPENDKLSPINALQQIDGLFIDALEALKTLYSYGLRNHHLRNWPGVFLHATTYALTHLITVEKASVEDAIARIKAMSLHDLEQFSVSSPNLG